MISKLVKKLLWVFVVLAVLNVAAVFAVPFLLPTEKVAGFLQDEVRKQTGRELAFTKARFSVWPNLGIELEQATLGNPAWAQQKNMVSLGKAEVALELLPLFDQHIVVKKFILNEPSVYLETAADGRQNWDFSGKERSVAGSTAPSHESKGASAPGQQAFDFRFDRVQITKGKFILADQQKKTSTVIEGVDVDVILPDLKSPLRLSGGLTYGGKRVTLDMGLDRPIDFFNGRTSSGQVHLKGDGFAVKADGAFSTQGALLKGDVDISVTDLAGVVAWLQNEKLQKLPFEKLSVTGAARVTGTEVVLKEAALTLDEVKANGDVGLAFGGAKPSLLAQMSMNKLNLDRFTGGKEASSSSKGGARTASSGNGEGWDATPLDFSGLRKLNADLKLKTEGFSLRGNDVGPSTLEVKLLNGSLHFTSSEAALSGGKFSSDLRLNAATATPSVAFVFDMADVQAQPILATFAGFKKLSGAANAHVSLTGSGNSQKDIISTLGGSGKVEFRDGELQGIDLVKIAKLVQKRSTDVGVDDGSTKFVTLAGTFSIANGIINNTDMKMTGKVVQATGQGTVDLPRKYIQYKATPVLLVSGDAPPALSVPVKITGPFDKIKVVPDFASAVRDVVNDPSSAKRAFKNIKENLKGDLKQNELIQGILNFKKNKQAPAPLPTPVPEQAPQEAAPVAPAEQQPVLTP